MTATTRNQMARRRGLTRVVGVALGASALGAVLSACDPERTLAVTDPDVVQLENLTTRAALPAVRAATIGDFQVAYSGSNASEGQIQASAWLTDEQANAESFPTRIEVDMRNTNPINVTMLGLFRAIQRARATAEVASRRYGSLDPADPAWAEVLAIGGFTYVLLGENYCSGVPSSQVNEDGSFTYGPSEATTEVFGRALAKFDSAIARATAAGNAGTTALNLARVGKARTLLDLNRVTEAAAVAADVPNTFRYQVIHSENTSRQNNGIFIFADNGRRFTIPDREGGNGLPFRSEGQTDARLATRRRFTATGAPVAGFDAVTPLWLTAKYVNRSAPATVADGVEARLIQAEAFMRAGDDVNFLAQLNLARANAQTYAVPPATPPAGPGPLTAADLGTSAQSRQDLLFKERAYNLFLTSHRLGDLRRLIRQYGRNAESVFPTGAYFKGGVYGPDVNLPIPFEENFNLNPDYEKGCLDRNA